MCGRYSLTTPPQAMEAIFGVRARLNVAPRYNIAPSDDIVSIFRDPDYRDGESQGGRHMGMMRWGYIAPWAKAMDGPQPINARIETIAEKRMFSGNFRHRRCIIPADSFFEWRALPGGKQPYLIRRQDGEMMAFAGIWSEFNPPGENPMRTVAIVTTASDGPVKFLHDRMPVILSDAFFAAWLGEEDIPARALLEPPHLSGDQLEFFPVSKTVNTVANDGPDCLKPVDIDAAKPRAVRPAAPKQGSLF